MMKKIVHISDLHFGTENYTAVESLLTDIKNCEPDLVVISGDLTQRAKTYQFNMVGQFIAQIKFPKIIVPGNHDISLYNLFRRFFRPLKRFEKYILNNPFPEYEDDRLLVVGINSSRSLTIQSGRVNKKQVEYLRQRYSKAADDQLKVLVVHHNVFPLKGEKLSAGIGRSKLITKLASDCRLNLVLSGHLHKGYSIETNNEFIKDHNIIIVQAGTATSSRLRGEKNSYNIVEYDKKLRVKIKEFTGEGFKLIDKREYLI